LTQPRFDTLLRSLHQAAEEDDLGISSRTMVVSIPDAQDLVLPLEQLRVIGSVVNIKRVAESGIVLYVAKLLHHQSLVH
jgi:hypothetical protein